MKAAYLITIATATLWSCVLCAPTTEKTPSPGAAHRHMPKIVAAYEELRKKFENLKAVMSEIKALGYTGGDLPAFSMKNKTETTKSGAPDFSDFIHMPGASTGTAAPGKSIDDAPVESKMTPSERMKLLSQKFHAAHKGRGSMLSPAVGATSTVPLLAADRVNKLKSALSQFKTDIKEAILSETPVENPHTKKEKVDIAEQMRAKLKVQNRLQKFRQQMANQRVHRVGEIRPVGSFVKRSLDDVTVSDDVTVVDDVSRGDVTADDAIVDKSQLLLDDAISDTQLTDRQPDGQNDDGVTDDPVILNRAGYNRIKRSAPRNPRARAHIRRRRGLNLIGSFRCNSQTQKKDWQKYDCKEKQRRKKTNRRHRPKRAAFSMIGPCRRKSRCVHPHPSHPWMRS